MACNSSLMSIVAVFPLYADLQQTQAGVASIGADFQNILGIIILDKLRHEP